MTDYKHCDDYIRDKTQPKCLRKFLLYNRLPEDWKHKRWKKSWGVPVLVARIELSKLEPKERYDIKKAAHMLKFKDTRYIVCRVTMASRMGDVGVVVCDIYQLLNDNKLNTNVHGYDFRLPVDVLRDFSESFKELTKTLIDNYTGFNV